MYSALHLGFEHPNVAWLVVTALLAFAAGLGVATYRVFGVEETDASIELSEESR